MPSTGIELQMSSLESLRPGCWQPFGLLARNSKQLSSAELPDA